jgi:hypothetical protein
MSQINATIEDGTINGVTWSFNTSKVEFSVEDRVATVERIYLDNPNQLENAIYELLEVKYIDNVVLFNSDDVERDTVAFGQYIDEVQPDGDPDGPIPKNLRSGVQDPDATDQESESDVEEHVGGTGSGGG